MVPFVSSRFKPAVRLVTLALLAGAGPAHASGGKWHVPAKFIKAVEGCWQVWPNERITIRRRGSDGLETMSQFDPPPPAGDDDARRRWAPAFYWPELTGIEVSCGRRSQHGQVCLLRTVDGKLEAQFWAITYEHTKHLTRTAFAERCAADRPAGR